MAVSSSSAAVAPSAPCPAVARVDASVPDDAPMGGRFLGLDPGPRAQRRGGTYAVEVFMSGRLAPLCQLL
eukprot:208408-Pyramimonas_sp.AAC.1